MKQYMPWIIAPFLALAACDSDDGNTNTSDTTDTTGGDTNVGPGVSALTGVNTNVTVTAPTPNAGCVATEVDNGDYGARYPWGGLTAGATTYTCNKCPGGLEGLQGSWRTHGWKADNEDEVDYSIGATADEANVLLVDGNTFSYEVRNADGPNYLARGYYVCSQKPEHPNEHIFWKVTEAEPANMLGSADVPEIWRSDVVLNSGTNNILLFWFQALTGNEQYSLGYCAIGTTRDGQTCNNPFQ